MGHLSRATGLTNTKKAVISLWFRIPQASFDAARAAWNAEPDPSPPLLGIVPLITLGPRDTLKKNLHIDTTTIIGTRSVQQKRWATSPTCAWFDDGAPVTENTGAFSASLVDGTALVQPSFIGVDCRGDNNILMVSLQFSFDTLASMDGTHPAVHSIDYASPFNYWNAVIESGCGNTPAHHIGGSPLPIETITNTRHVVSEAEAWLGLNPERLRTIPYDDNIWGSAGLPSNNYGGAGQSVTAGQWHHLLLSFDMQDVQTKGTGTAGPGNAGTTAVGTVQSASKLYISFDDVNLTGTTLTYFTVPGLGDNDILTPNAMFIYKDRIIDESSTFDDFLGHNLTESFVGYAQPSYLFATPALPLNPIKIPGTTDVNQVVEMAELQIFTDVSLDTGVLDNRRGFVTEGGTPAPAAAAAALFGKQPQIYLHGQKNWQSGKNTGSSGGLFTRDGTINPFLPGPQLGA